MLIVLTGGGTGGHIFPLVAVAKKLKTVARERGIEDIRFLYVGPRFDVVSEEIFRHEGIDRSYIFSSKLRRYMSPLTLLDIVKFPLAVLQAVWIIFWHMPDAVFSKGGYGSFPVMLASWFFFIPSRVIHESDSIPGIANIMAIPFAKRIGTAFQSAALKFPVEKTAVVGIPVREDLCLQDPKKAKLFFNIASDRKVILVVGGSQGARAINAVVAQALPRMLEKYEVIHLCGSRHFEAVKAEAALAVKGGLANYYHPYPFLTEEFKLAFSLAHIVVARASATTIFEIAFCGKPSILIPLKGAAQDHQRKNAYEYAKTGATVVIEEDNLTPNLLFSNIVSVLEDPAAMEKMSSGAAAFAIRDSAEVIAKEILQLRGVV
ncbi:UDP-N-acetylglucosamine--N-acetylmuramyl-(pentapeptide) pyrophosphoryl-undecaprenol N-acetylglucosamine transferase [Candidatus Azambacteria bacterium]|nr:UDP-N-acetylglucosamine--N-acetylmuramyl-(pentapeptide) pyrophosphoryl-undecaprenol N-acetylglucosamine transferase [Candidatus Azambacteria bacterium]